MRPLLPVAALLSALACGPGDVDGPLFPLVVGMTWDYRTTDSRGAPSARTVRVAGREGEWFVLETHENGVVRRTWLEEGDLVLAIREIETAPDAVRMERRFEPGALRGIGKAGVAPGRVFERSWIASDTRRPARSRWTVEAVGETIDCAAGHFTDAVRIRREEDGVRSRLWLVPGVGLVRAEGAERMELVHWTLP